MLPVQALNIIQTGLKHFLDVDPAVTEHLVRNAISGSLLVADGALTTMRSIGVKFAEMMTPVVHDVREFRLNNLHL